MFSFSGQMFNNLIQLYTVVEGGKHTGRVKNYHSVQICSETADALSTPTQLLFVALAFSVSWQHYNKRNSSKLRTFAYTPPAPRWSTTVGYPRGNQRLLLSKHASSLTCLLTNKNKPLKWKKKPQTSPVPFPNSNTGFTVLQKGLKVKKKRKKKSTFITRSNYEEWRPLTYLPSFWEHSSVTKVLSLLSPKAG